MEPSGPLASGSAADLPAPPAPVRVASPPKAQTAPAPGDPVATSAKLAPAAGLDRQIPSTKALGTSYRLVARASDSTWIRVRMEGGRTTEETMSAGDVREWISNRPFELQIANAGGLSLELNGQALPALGARGSGVMRIVVPMDAQ